MRKFLSLVLAIVMVASLSVIAFSAAGSDKATVTITGFNNESSDSKTYAVGETFTAYVYLNASGLNTDGMIGSLKGKQYYTNSVLELADAYDAADGGMIADLDAMFPITKGQSVANGMLEGCISYNASNPSMTKAFKFNSDDSLLIVTHYTVKAAGTADITNEIVTLAIADFYLTKAVHQSAVYDDNFTVRVALSEPAAAEGSTVSGTVTSFNDSAEGLKEVTVQLLQGDEVKYETSVNGNTVDYSIADVADGDYTLRVSKENHVTRDYDITVSGNTAADAKIHLLGDVTGDGVITTLDFARANAHAKGVLFLTGYDLKVANVVGADDAVTTLDAARINAHAKGVIRLW